MSILNKNTLLRIKYTSQENESDGKIYYFPLFVYEYLCAMNVAFQTTKYHAYYSSLKYGNELADLIIHTDKLWNYHSSTFALQYDHISSSSHFGHQ